MRPDGQTRNILSQFTRGTGHNRFFVYRRNTKFLSNIHSHYICPTCHVVAICRWGLSCAAHSSSIDWPISASATMEADIADAETCHLERLDAG